jgi:cobalt-zinc-cadmium efflux system outer membrane protein
LVAEALSHHPELLFLEAEVGAARAGVRTAGRLSNPELSGTVGQNRVRPPGGDPAAEGIAWSVGLMQPFEWPGRLGLRKAIANQQVTLAELGLARFKSALAGRVRGLAYSLGAFQEQADASREVADRLRALREVLVQRDPAGLTPLLETRIIEATELIALRSAAEAELAVIKAHLELNQLRGAEPDASLTIAPANPTFRPIPSLETLVAMTRTNHFELRLRTSELELQGFRVELARNERFPSFSVGPTFSEENAVDRQRVIGLAVSIPLPLWNNNRASVDIARARRSQAEASLRAAQRELDQQISLAARTYENKIQSLARWRRDAIQHFQEAADTADRNYRLGAVPVATYVELQRQYVEAVEALITTRREALEAAAQLETLAGLSESLVGWDPTTKAP